MTKQQETDIVKLVNSNLRWTIGISVTIVIFIISMKIAEVRADAEFKGEIKTEVTTIKEEIKDIKQQINNKTDNSYVVDIKKLIEKNSKEMKDLSNDIDNIEFFLSKWSYKPIPRNINM